MGWDRTKYEAVCADCGKTGYVIKADDDWGRSETTWIGFENRSPDPTAVARKRTDARDSTPVCQCGSSKITVGSMLGACDYKGDLYTDS